MMNPGLESKLSDIHSWWEVPCIAHFCSLFRASFNLIDFDIEDLEEALLTDDASDSGNTLIQELIVRLLRGYYANNSISTFNYQMFLRRLFRQKCREFSCYNPFDSDVDFQFLPMRTKVEILHMLCDFRLDADDVLDILKDLDSDSLRVHPLGYDANKSAYWYFYGTRLYREDYPKKKKEKEKKRGRKRKKGRNKEEEEESDDEEVDLGSGVWQVVCFTESDWERLAVNTEDATDKNEQALHQIIEEDFLPEIPKLFQEKERLQRKRFLELHPRKSSRIENLKRRKEEEKQYLEKYKRALMNEDGTDSEADSELSARKARNERYERWKNRNTCKDGSYYSDEENSDCDSLPESVRSFTTRTAGGSFICGRGRQTNNSLSSVTGEIIIHPSERSQSPGRMDTKREYLNIGMSRILNKLKVHEDSWPFLEPVDEGDAPNYYKVVKTPMSLQRMEDKLDGGKYRTLSEFKHDFQLMMSNCKQYNGSKNEYTSMGEKLERVFNSLVNHLVQQINSSEGEDITENSDFPDGIGAHKKRKRRRRKRTSSKSTEDADKENEEKSIDAIYSFNSLDSETRNADDDLSVESRVGEQKPVKRGKGRPPKNSSSVDALEQTLRDINKWLDNTPKVTEPCSASNSPPLLSPPRSETVADVPAPPVPSETTTAPKSTARPAKPKDLSKKRSVKENHHKHLQLIKHCRRDIQRTIDRLQPGKSKGNLISTIGKAPTKSNVADKPSGSKDSIAKTESTPHRPKPMLSLGSVLSADIINLDTNRKKHTFSDNDSIPSDDEDVYSENEDADVDQHEMQAENLALDKPSTENAQAKTTEEKTEVKTTPEAPPVQSDNTAAESAKPAVAAVEKGDKPKPNLGAWFKAFGAPKAQQTPRRKPETTHFNENAATPMAPEDVKDDYPTMSERSNRHTLDEDRYDTNELPPPTPGRFFLYEEDKDQRNVPVSLPSPDLKPMRRQRKLSTGSSVSERSSFSQDPNDPMNSPHPSLDESVYQSPQPYHQSPVHNTALKVGFYQDAFPKSNSCSPRDPMNSISPQHPMFSPRDSLASPRDSICSPRDVVTSPRGEPVASPRDLGSLPMSSPRSAVASPRYAAVSPRDTYSESLRSPYAKSPVYTPTAVPSTEAAYKSYKPVAPPSTVQSEKPFSIYPVKKRISAELEQTNRQQSEYAEKTRDQSFVSAAHEAERHYSPVPVPLPQHMLPPSSSYNSEASSMPISLSHHPVHPHHPGYMDSYPHDPMLMNPYFRKDLYVPSQGISSPVPGQSSLYISQNGDNLPQGQPHYSPPRQPSPLMSSTYGRGNVPLDFTAAANSSPLPLTSKPNENYPSQYHPKYSLPAESALNFSNKNAQHIFYPPVEPDRKMPNEYQRNKVETPIQHYDSRTPEGMYHPTAAHSYRSAPSPYVNPPADYYSGSKPTNYSAPNLRYSSFDAPADRPLSRNDKQYYQPPPQANPPSAMDPAYMGDNRSMELLNASRSTFSQPKLTALNTNPPVVGHYETSYQAPTPQATATPAKAPKKSKKKKAAAVAALAEPPASETPPQNSSVYPHHYLPVSQANVPPPQDLKHNGIMSSSPFNFNATAALKSDYQQYFDLRNSRFFAEPAANGEKTNAPPPPAPGNSFPFLQRGNPPSFSLTAQAFMNANTSPCPPSIYSSPYLQRAPEELLRPMMLPQGLMPSAHGGGYPPGYINMHDPINRSPWI